MSDYPSLFDEAIHDGDDMEIRSVRETTEFEGWSVEMNKCRESWRQSVREAGYRVASIYPKGRTLSVKVRVEQ